MKRRHFMGALLAAAAWPAHGASRPGEYVRDFDVLWHEIDGGYAYFDGRRDRWHAARDGLRRRAARAATDAEFAAVLEAAIARLRDDHVTLAPPRLPTRRRIPYDLDIWPRWLDGAAAIEAVRTFGDADVAGLHPGHVVTRIDGIAVPAAVRGLLGGPASVADREWALRRLLAGPPTGTQRLEVIEGGGATAVEIERSRASTAAATPILGRRMGEDRDIAYIRARIGANERIGAHFEAALGQMGGTRALIVDLRENVAPGSRAVTESILAQFVSTPAPWQLRVAPGGMRSVDTVRPASGTPYASPVIVLVDRWTAGEGEALAAGLAAVANARLVGTATAGLHGELRSRTLPHSGIVVRYPAERTFLASGAAREALEPAVRVDPAAPSGGPGDPILYQALKLLERR